MGSSRLAAVFPPLFLMISMLSAVPVPESSDGKLLLVLLDGFRWDMDRLEDLPHLAAFSAEGVNVPYVTPAYVTLTVPNIFTILTGCHPETHGVLHNVFFDKSTGQFLLPEEVDNSTQILDPGVEPLIVTASRQGKRTGTYMLTPIPGMLPDIYYYQPLSTLNETYGGFLEGVDTVLRWFTDDDIDFTTFYIAKLDAVSHIYGPESPAARSVLKEIDGVIGYLLEQVKQRGLADLNIILVADHGMRQVYAVPDPIEILRHVNASSLQMLIADYGPLALIQPAPGRREEVYAALAGSHPNMTVYHKEDFPTRFHYANHPRMTDILAMADPGYVIYSRYSGALQYQGEHGYDNRDPAMRALFRAWGPNFRRGYARPDPFDSVHIYPLMCAVLGVETAPNNGSLAEVADMLASVGCQGTREYD